MRLRVVNRDNRCSEVEQAAIATRSNVRNCEARRTRPRALPRTATMTRMRARSLGELRVRGTQALHACLERLSDIFTSHLRTSRAGAAAPRILDDGIARLAGSAGADPATVARAIARLDPQLLARFAAQSDALERGWICLLGHEALWVGNPPRWNRDAVSSIEAPQRHWSRIDHLDSTLVGDHKVLWELNRHQ